MEKKPHLTYIDIEKIIGNYEKRNISEISTLPSFEDGNYLVDLVSNHTDTNDSNKQIVIKASHAQKFNYVLCDVRRRMMQHLTQDGFICSVIIQSSNGEWFHVYSPKDDEDTKEAYIIQIYTYIPGSPLNNNIQELNASDVISEVGELVSLMHNSMKNFSLPCDFTSCQSDSLWRMDNFCRLEEILQHIEGKEKRDLVMKVIEAFRKNVLPVYDQLTKGIIHGDIHDLNIIVNNQGGQLQPIYHTDDPGDVKKKYGLIDFNDTEYSCFIFEVAMVIRDFMTTVRLPSNLYIGNYFLTGYLKHGTLSVEEIDILPTCVAAGLCQYIVVGEYEFQSQPDNEYRRMGADGAWVQIKEFWEHSKATIIDIWKSDLFDSGQ